MGTIEPNKSAVSSNITTTRTSAAPKVSTSPQEVLPHLRPSAFTKTIPSTRGFTFVSPEQAGALKYLKVQKKGTPVSHYF
jgi:hypothetical protein